MLRSWKSALVVVVAFVALPGCMVSRMRAHRDDPDVAAGAKVLPGACAAHFDRAAGVLAEMDLSVKSADRAPRFVK